MKKVRLGLIGAGWWGTAHHLPTAMNREEVIMDSVSRLGSEELEIVKNEFNFDFASENFLDVIERKPDGIIVSSPHTLHYEHSIAALKAGIPVLCEKPMTTSAEEARDLVNTAKKNNVHLMMSHGLHYLELVQKAKEYMKENIIGDIEYLVCVLSSPVRDLLEGRGLDLKGAKVLFTPENNTWADPVRAGGGYGYAQLTHILGLTFLLADIVPKKVFSFSSSPNSQVEIHNSISVQCEDGIVATFSGSASHKNNRFKNLVRIYGSKGELELELDRENTLSLNIINKDYTVLKDSELQAHKEKPVTNASLGDPKGFQPTNNFIDLISGKSEVNWSPGIVGMRSIEVLDAAYRSATSGQLESV